MTSRDRPQHARKLMKLRNLTGERDKIITEAYRAGFTKMEIHKLTGVARTTIDEILRREEGSDAIAGTSTAR